jgi:ABC-type multidrug transport system permease subunit
VQTILHLMRAEMRRLGKSPSVPLLWLAFPIALSLIFYLAFGSMGTSSTGIPKGKLLVVDRDGSVASGIFKQALEREPMADFLTPVPWENEARITQQFRANAASAAIVIPAGLQDSLLAGGRIEFVFTTNPRQSVRPQMIEAILDSFFEIANYALIEVRGALDLLRDVAGDAVDRSSVLAISGAFYDSSLRLQKFEQLRNLDVDVIRPAPREKHPSRSGGASSFFTYFMPGLLLFSMLMVGEGFEKRFFHDVAQGRARRMAASPVPRRLSMLAEGFSILAGTLLCAAVLLIASRFLFHVRLRQPLGLLLFLTGFGFLVVGLLKSLYARAKSERAAGTIAGVVILMNTLVGGGFVPVEFFASGVQPFAQWTPVGCTSQGLLELLARNRGIAEVVPMLLRTWGWAIGLCLLAFLLGRKSHARV